MRIAGGSLSVNSSHQWWGHSCPGYQHQCECVCHWLQWQCPPRSYTPGLARAQWEMLPQVLLLATWSHGWWLGPRFRAQCLALLQPLGSPQPEPFCCGTSHGSNHHCPPSPGYRFAQAHSRYWSETMGAIAVHYWHLTVPQLRNLLEALAEFPAALPPGSRIKIHLLSTSLSNPGLRGVRSHSIRSDHIQSLQVEAIQGPWEQPLWAPLYRTPGPSLHADASGGLMAPHLYHQVYLTTHTDSRRSDPLLKKPGAASPWASRQNTLCGALIQCSIGKCWVQRASWQVRVKVTLEWYECFLIPASLLGTM